MPLANRQLITRLRLGSSFAFVLSLRTISRACGRPAAKECSTRRWPAQIECVCWTEHWPARSLWSLQGPLWVQEVMARFLQDLCSVSRMSVNVV